MEGCKQHSFPGSKGWNGSSGSSLAFGGTYLSVFRLLMAFCPATTLLARCFQIVEGRIYRTFPTNGLVVVPVCCLRHLQVSLFITLYPRTPIHPTTHQTRPPPLPPCPTYFTYPTRPTHPTHPTHPPTHPRFCCQVMSEMKARVNGQSSGATRRQLEQVASLCEMAHGLLFIRFGVVGYSF